MFKVQENCINTFLCSKDLNITLEKCLYYYAYWYVHRTIVVMCIVSHSNYSNFDKKRNRKKKLHIC